MFLARADLTLLFSLLSKLSPIAAMAGTDGVARAVAVVRHGEANQTCGDIIEIKGNGTAESYNEVTARGRSSQEQEQGPRSRAKARAIEQ